MTNHEEFYWQSKPGQKIFAQAWVPAQVQGVVALVHGLGEHSGRYAHVARRFNEAGLAVFALDLPGHGRTEGKRGVGSFEACFNEVDHLLGEARQRFPNQPIFLYGHSMGAAITLKYILARKPKISGAIITSPPLAAVSVSPVKYNLARILSRITPDLTMANGLNVQHISRDAQVVSAYQADPLVHPQISTRLGWDLLSAGDWIRVHAAELTLPLLLVHGSSDLICNSSGSQDFAGRAPASLVTLKLWDGLYHETHNDPEKDEVLAYSLAWIIQHRSPENGILASAS